ncbi:hypothetical protein GRI89_15875 [Altererythrobacter salegens]|uniref:Uncharacterized protein n=1 Tax=Croceibacterium salegens TaxID=1737568 RepID=A0A6I4SYE2_9SPHN|nr:hypothetical protein [Croceibacterium salegens]MXO61021.1 hypothetical protein [Croceibacterium salegens]
MSGPLSGLFAALAIVPAMVGTIEAGEHSLSLALCNGGSLMILVPGRQAPLPGTQPCCVEKGCRTGEKRKRFDPAQ